MKIGITHFNVKPDKIGDFKRIWEQHIGGMKRDAKGFQAAVLFTNPNTGKCLSVGFYDSETSAKAVNSMPAYQNLLSGVRDFVTSEPSREIDDITGEEDLIRGGRKAA